MLDDHHRWFAGAERCVCLCEDVICASVRRYVSDDEENVQRSRTYGSIIPLPLSLQCPEFQSLLSCSGAPIKRSKYFRARRIKLSFQIHLSLSPLLSPFRLGNNFPKPNFTSAFLYALILASPIPKKAKVLAAIKCMLYLPSKYTGTIFR